MQAKAALYNGNEGAWLQLNPINPQVCEIVDNRTSCHGNTQYNPDSRLHQKLPWQHSILPRPSYPGKSSRCSCSSSRSMSLIALAEYTTVVGFPRGVGATLLKHAPRTETYTLQHTPYTLTAYPTYTLQHATINNQLHYHIQIISFYYEKFDARKIM